jgi:hypothetical protein
MATGQENFKRPAGVPALSLPSLVGPSSLIPQSVSEETKQSAMRCHASQEGHPDDAIHGSVQLMLLVPLFQFTAKETPAASSASLDSTSSLSSAELQDVVVDMFKVNDPSSITYYSMDQVGLEGLRTGQPAAHQHGTSSSSFGTRNPAIIGVHVKEYDITPAYVERCHAEKVELMEAAIRAHVDLSRAQDDLDRSN